MDTTNLDDLLNQAESQETSNDEWVLDFKYETKDFYVDEHGAVEIRNKTIGNMSNHISVKGESYSQYIEFKMNRFYDGVDLTTMALAIYYEIPNVGSDESRPINVYYNEREIKFGWAVPLEITQNNLTITLCIYFRGKLPDGKGYVLKTKPANYLIDNGLDLGSGIIQPTENWYLNFVLEMDSKVQIATDAAVQSLNSSNVAKESESVVLQSKQVVEEKSDDVNKKYAEVQTMHSETKNYRDEAEQFRNEAEQFTPDGYSNLIEQVNENTDGIEEIKDSINSGFKKVESGEDIHITDSADARIPEFHLFGKAKQQTTSGANLLKNVDVSKVTNNGVSVEVKKSRLHLVGTPTKAELIYANGEYASTKALFVLPPGEYTLCEDLYLVEFDGTSRVNKEGKFTLSRDYSVTAIGIYNDVSKTFSEGTYYDISIDMMLNSGTELLPFEPYTGGIPSPNPDYTQEIEVPNGDVVVKSCGKNLLKNMATTQNINDVSFVVNEDDRSVTANGTATADCYLSLGSYANNVYKGCILNGCPKNGTANTYRLIAQYRNENNEWVSNDSDLGNGVIIRDFPKISIQILVKAGTTVNNLVFKPMLRPASITDDTYEPYKETTATIPVTDFAGIPVSDGGNYTDENGQQWITDEIVKFSDGSGEKIQRIVVDTFVGDLREKWMVDVNKSFIYQTQSFKSTIPNTEILSNKYICKNVQANNLPNNSIKISDYLYVKDERFTTLNEFLSDLSVNPLVVMYSLTEPIRTPLTAEEISEIEKLHTFAPITNVSNNADCGMQVTYYIVKEADMLNQSYYTSKKNEKDISVIQKELRETTFKVDTIIEKADLGIKNTASGEEIHVDDSANAKVREFALFGKARQQTTSGNQLANLPDTEEFEKSGIKWSCKNGVVKAVGTSTDISTSSPIRCDIPIVEGDYHVSGAITTVSVTKADGSVTYYHSQPFRLDGTETSARLYCQVEANKTVNYTIYPMLNEGTTALPWEPYTGGKPSPSPEYKQDVEVATNPTVDSAGNNLLDISTEGTQFIGNYWINTFEFSHHAEYQCYRIKVNEGKSYIITTDASELNMTIRFEDASNKAIGGIHWTNMKGKPFVIPEGVKYIAITLSINRINQYYHQLELGDKGTKYEPFKGFTSATIQGEYAGIPVSSGGNYTDQSGQQWICDEIRKYADGSGERIQRINKHVFNGNEGWNVSSNLSGRYTIPPSLILNPKTNQVPLTNMFVGSVDDTTELNKCRINGAGTFYVNTDFDTVDDFKTHLAENNMIIYYKLATPIRTPLAAEEIAEIEKLSTFYPVTNISNDFDCGMSVTYVADSKLYIDSKIAELATAMVNNI